MRILVANLLNLLRFLLNNYYIEIIVEKLGIDICKDLVKEGCF